MRIWSRKGEINLSVQSSFRTLSWVKGCARRWAVACMCVLLLLSCVPPLPVFASSAPARVIHVVYDDSGSMFKTGGVLVDTWCQAKYSMEVFAAMLGESDQMNIYYMSDYLNGTSAGPRIQLDGKNGANANVEQVHAEKTVAGNTPFNAVVKAYTDLDKTVSDEKWLLILTDGEFQGVDGQAGIDAFLAKKSADINVMFLGMGADAGGITEKQNQGIFYVSAQTSRQILTNITDICTRIFNSHKLEVNVGAKTVSFDVPMSELTVFAQGANVSIDRIKREDGTSILCAKAPVEVMYSECDATNYNNQPVKDLMGKIAVFKDDFPAGKYTLDVSGAETIEIYYKTNIEVAAYLTDSQGNEVEDLSDLAAGTYTISFGFVKAGTKEPVAESALLGNIDYEAEVTNNGTVHEQLYGNGDQIVLEEGPLDIDVTAVYLDHYSVTTHLAYDIYKDKTIDFLLLQDPDFTVCSQGLERGDDIKIAVKIDGTDFTAQQWEAFEVPQIQLVSDDLDFKLELDELQKTDQIGVLQTAPIFPGGKPSTGTYRDVDYQIVCQQLLGSETWQGSMNGTVKLQDTRSWLERNWDLFVKLFGAAMALIILAGYLPIFKHYLPKSLKRKPYIKCIPSEPGEKRKERSGLFEKNLLSTLVPYAPQTGTIKYVPKGVTGCPVMSVKAIKHCRMALTNVKAFAGKDYITFDGTDIKKDTKKFETGAGVSIRVKRGTWTYVCSPNQSS